ncbi:MAG: hypothetical protein IKQ41_02245 [Clostridia bacterium]|nr:hypothetical protein [Clostridia bacterium]
MGKQLNYYMEYDRFLLLAKKALELGCEIIRDEHTDEIQRGFSLDLITPELIFYYFRVPQAGDIITGIDMYGKQYVKGSYSSNGSCLIEAGFSAIWETEKLICSNRLYSSSGYYDENKAFVGRPECTDKVYKNLVRYAKKIAPKNEIVIKQLGAQDITNLPGIELKEKFYMTDYCLQLQRKGFILR